MKVQAAILDWAGTVVDHGSRAPMGAFVRAFAQFGVTDQHRRCARADGHGEVGPYPRRRPAPSVAAAWRARHGRDFNEADVDAIFQVFEPMNIAAVRDHADIIPGALAAIEALRQRGMKHRRHDRLYAADHGRAGTTRRGGRLRAGADRLRR